MDIQRYFYYDHFVVSLRAKPLFSTFQLSACRAQTLNSQQSAYTTKQLAGNRLKSHHKPKTLGHIVFSKKEPCKL